MEPACCNGFAGVVECERPGVTPGVLTKFNLRKRSKWLRAILADSSRICQRIQASTSAEHGRKM